MMAFVEIKRRLERMTHPQKAYALNQILSTAFEDTEGHSFGHRLDYNARLMTYLRREKVWPPC